jgi:hypothetical protein
LRHPEFLQKIKTIWDEHTRDRVTLDKVQFKLKKVKKNPERVGLQFGWCAEEKKERDPRGIDGS